MSDAHVRVTVVSDYLCPWCYIGMARIERLEREFELDVTWHPFELHPEVPAEGIVRGDRPSSPQRAAMYEQLRALAGDAGLPFERGQRVPNTHRALEAAEFAREHGAFLPYHRALFDAFFGRGQDIGDAAVLAGVATSCGLDGTALRDALDAGRYAKVVDERTAEARGWGVTGTPTVIFESVDRRFPVVGAQDYEVFAHIARRFGALERAATSTSDMSSPAVELRE
jgi:predicted DsbA family dithiol-disulfide isomerase